MSKHKLKQKNDSSESIQTTRVKTRKKTVGITLPKNLLERARKRNLNISRITEQALISILDYLQPQNESESSKSLAEASLLREGSKPRWLSSVERQPRKLLVAGSKPARGSISNKTTHLDL